MAEILEMAGMRSPRALNSKDGAETREEVEVVTTTWMRDTLVQFYTIWDPRHMCI